MKNSAIITKSTRFEVRSTKNVKFKHENGFTLGRWYGVYDLFACKYVSNEGENHPWEYKNKSVAADIVNQFNTLSPAGKLSYGKVLLKK